MTSPTETPTICQHDATLEEIAALIDCTPRHARRLLDGVEKSARGRWPLGPAIRGCLEKLVDSPAGDQLTKERTGLVRAQRLQAELEYAKAKEAVAPLGEITKVWTHRAALIQTNMLNIPARSVIQLLGCTDEATFKRVLRAEIIIALEQSRDAEMREDEIFADDSDDDDNENEEPAE